MTHCQRRQWHPTPVLLPGEAHGRRSLVGCSPRGRIELDTTEQLHFHFSLSCIREGNGNPLQCSCLENPRDRGAWWAVIYGVAQSRTRLNRLSSSSSSSSTIYYLKLITVPVSFTKLQKHWKLSITYRKQVLSHFEKSHTFVAFDEGACLIRGPSYGMGWDGYSEATLSCVLGGDV